MVIEASHTVRSGLNVTCHMLMVFITIFCLALCMQHVFEICKLNVATAANVACCSCLLHLKHHASKNNYCADVCTGPQI